MEYTYQNSATEPPHKVILNEYNLTISSTGTANTIPYSMIKDVKLVKESEKHFYTMIQLNNGRSYSISNKSFQMDQKPKDQSRAYSTFVRVLHFHLKDKSKANFTSGNKTGKMWMQVIFSVIASFLLSFTAEFFGVSLVNPFVQAAVLMIMMGIIILALSMGRWPKHYSPSDIPLEFLP